MAVREAPRSKVAPVGPPRKRLSWPWEGRSPTDDCHYGMICLFDRKGLLGVEKGYRQRYISDIIRHTLPIVVLELEDHYR